VQLQLQVPGAVAASAGAPNKDDFHVTHMPLTKKPTTVKALALASAKSALFLDVDDDDEQTKSDEAKEYVASGATVNSRAAARSGAAASWPSSSHIHVAAAATAPTPTVAAPTPIAGVAAVNTAGIAVVTTADIAAAAAVSLDGSDGGTGAAYGYPQLLMHLQAMRQQHRQLMRNVTHHMQPHHHGGAVQTQLHDGMQSRIYMTDAIAPAAATPMPAHTCSPPSTVLIAGNQPMHHKVTSSADERWHTTSFSNNNNNSHVQSSTSMHMYASNAHQTCATNVHGTAEGGEGNANSYMYMQQPYSKNTLTRATFPITLPSHETLAMIAATENSNVNNLLNIVNATRFKRSWDMIDGAQAA
jgi:hypothetical protein